MSKRRHLEGSEAPATKRAKVESAEDSPLLVYQKANMLLRIKELNREVDEARSSQDHYENEIRAFHDRMAVIDRHWSGLESTLSQVFIHTRNTKKEATEGEEEQTFAKLLADALRGLAPSIMDICARSKSTRLTKVTLEESKQLEERGMFARALIEKIVDAVDFEKKRNEELNQKLVENTSISNKDLISQNELLTSTIEQLRKENEELQVSLANREKDVKDQKNFAASLREKLCITTSERDTLEGRAILAERKLDKVECIKEAIVAPPISAPAVKMPSTITKKNIASPKARFKKAAQQSNVELSSMQEENTQLKEKLKKAKSIAESRLKEINEYGEQRKILLQQIKDVRNEREKFTEETILNSHHYVLAQNSLQALKHEYKVMKESLENKLKLSNESQLAVQNENQITRQRASDTKNALTQEISIYQSQIGILTKKMEELIAKQEHKNQPKEETKNESNLLLTTQQTQLVKLREECGRLRKQKMEMSEREQKVKELSEQLSEKAAQFSALSEKHQSLADGLANTEKLEKAELQQQISTLTAHYQEIKQIIDCKDNTVVNVEEIFFAVKKVEELAGTAEKLTKKMAEYQKENAAVKEALESQKEESEAYLMEIDEISKELDDTQKQNVRLCEQVSVKETTNQKLMKECIDLKSVKHILQKQIALLNQSMETAKQKSLKQEELFQAEISVMGQLREQIMKLQEELQVGSVQIDIQQRRLHETLEKNGELQASLNASKLTISSLTLSDESIISYNQEALKNHRLSEKNVVLKKKLDRLRSSNVLEEELRVYKDLLTCPVCNERQKNAVIAKCFHVFCKECIQKRVSTRSRKCPSCSKGFGADDVHDIYLNFQA